MRLVQSLVLAGTALFATGIAVAATHHVLNVPLGDGSVARVDYEGEVAPRVTVIPGARQAAAPAGATGGDSFAEMDAMFAAMERRHEAMMRQMAAMEGQGQGQADPPVPMMRISVGDGAPGGGSYSFSSSTTTSAGGCGHSVEIIQQAGAAPQRVERSFGNCGGAHEAPTPRPSAVPAPAAIPALPTV